MTRLEVLNSVANHLTAREVNHPLRVGIDGVCGAGKTTFALDLVRHLRTYARPTIYLDSDGFHNRRAIRYRQGKESARGYYDDAYDFDALRELALVPLGPNGSRRYALRVHDMATDSEIRAWAVAPQNAIVIFDATFIQRDDLRKHWDEVVYLDAPIDQAQARGVARDSRALGGIDSATSAYESRYMAACRIYLTEQHPREQASILINHADPTTPFRLEANHPPEN